MEVDFKDVFFINPSVDVYKIGNDILEFYFINTKRRVTINVTPLVFDLISSFNKELTLEDICKKLGISIDNEITSFILYLRNESIIFSLKEQNKDKNIISEQDRQRYDRQLLYFDTLSDKSSFKIQDELQQQVVLIFGVGAIGSGIAIQLAMTGIRNFIILDKDFITRDSISRHFYFNEANIGESKVDALSKYLKQLDSSVSCETYKMILDYDTDISSLIQKASFIVNTTDEPYIGITSLKIGRECFKYNKPLYISGGFDAHLMSTGELIIPGITPCVDCYTNYFTKSLQDWKPIYNTKIVTEKKTDVDNFEVGGLASMSLFSISYAVLKILNFLTTNDNSIDYGRGELLFNSLLNINYLEVTKNPKCIICGNK
ncbi:ThiF family adenylyltransferase [Myroides pelagicus]|uniref:HesA/MoeB/ThiF family protein n=1 Tax=Myroides pelagicus TaxID=270914 RepID=UPI002DBA804D|nr:ThiF family adenylyltransferase [Myroides pelagicus]MEC4114948.1 ThiF family adenylyltransferase [Myroides pelagicus]